MRTALCTESHGVGPEDPFWSTPAGKAQEATATNGRHTDTVIVVWSHPRISQADSGKYDSTFPPDLDAAWFVGVLGLVNDLSAKRTAMSLSTMGLIVALQHESDTAMVMAPNWNILGPLRWGILWMLFGSVTTLRSLYGGESLLVRRLKSWLMERPRRSGEISTR